MNDSESLQLAEFKTENGEFTPKVQEISEMADIRRISRALLFAEGVINPRGKTVPIADLRKRVGFESRGYDRSTRIIVVGLESMVLGFIVDSVSEVTRVSESTVEPLPPLISDVESEYIERAGKPDNKLPIFPKLKKVFSSNDRRELEKVYNN